VHQKVLPLLRSALGALHDSETLRELDIGQLSSEAVFYDQFLLSVLAQLGRNIIELTTEDIAFVLRKCLHVMAQRFSGEY
jgi:hypothetical protein